MFQWKKTAESWERSKIAGGVWARKEGINADNETNLIWQVMKKEEEDGGVPCPRQSIVVSTSSFLCIWILYRGNTTPGCCGAGLGQKERAQMRTNLLETKTHQWNESKCCREEQGVWKAAVGEDPAVAMYSCAQRQDDGHWVTPQSVPCLCLRYTKGSRLCLWEMAATAPMTYGLDGGITGLGFQSEWSYHSLLVSSGIWTCYLWIIRGVAGMGAFEHRYPDFRAGYHFI